MKYNVGDKVKIRKDSHYYGDGNRNPANVIGVVVATDRKSVPYRYKVEWAKGKHNSYREHHLESAEPKKKISRKDIEELMLRSWMTNSLGSPRPGSKTAAGTKKLHIKRLLDEFLGVQ
jgi:hypothetical protein